MTLYADITARIDSQTLIEMTNKRDSSQTSVNTSYLQNVCDDVQGLIEAELGLIYADASLTSRDIAYQRAMAVQGVLIHLEMYASVEGSKIEGRYTRWIEALRKRRKSKGVTVDTNAKAAVTDDLAEDVPTFDRAYMKKYFVPRIGSSENAARVEDD